MKNLKFYFQKAQKEKWAIGQFNFSTKEQLTAIFLAAKKLNSPVIIGTSEGESRFFGLEEAVCLKKILVKRYNISVFLNLDHGKDLDYIKKAVKIGYEAVHFDGSHLSLKENLRLTKEIVSDAHKKKVLVEGEIDLIPGSSKLHREKIETKEELLSDPQKLLEFVEKTKVDSLAVNIGNIHGMGMGGENPHIDIPRLKEIREKIGESVFLVLHGGSGTPEADIEKAINRGVVKINVNTELRIAFLGSFKKFTQENPDELKPYKIFPNSIEAIQKVVEAKIKLFHSFNKA